MVPEIAPARLLRRLDELAAFGATPAGGVDRQALSQPEIAARRYVLDIAAGRGFRSFVDPIGNLFLRREGTDPSLPPVVAGSHLDSQPRGGRYDGALGVMAALECLEAIDDAGLIHRPPVEVVAWTNEEGSRFAPGAMGSMAYSGARPLAELLASRDAEGIAVADALPAALAATPEAEPRPLGAPLAAYLELHIEQGPVLEAEGIPVGIVTGIQGARWLEVTVSGEAGHAGTTPEAFRKDAFVAAQRIIAELRAALADPEDRTRFTIGRFALHPGSVNTIPAEATFSIDLRHPEEDRLDALETAVRSIVAERAAPCRAVIRPLLTIPGRRFPDRITGLCAEAVRECGFPERRLVSGAFHDAQFIAGICPSGMIFVPCRGGISHNEAEHVEPEHAVAGTRVLLAALLRLAA
ncbi:M20 family metallo-hydrolase [Inquilinus sp. Marseille-Q2685]|uniref:M20 family metallo-hydrolase n=1 Tax=Inquilinus sp. Marseille-Q2685 TaxID=2866581 RepID=UPI001CE45748|nr:M20 family metallo-hydrolase [Inquilinus sp. Marseille-Q2685]